MYEHLALSLEEHQPGVRAYQHQKMLDMRPTSASLASKGHELTGPKFWPPPRTPSLPHVLVQVLSLSNKQVILRFPQWDAGPSSAALVLQLLI